MTRVQAAQSNTISETVLEDGYAQKVIEFKSEFDNTKDALDWSVVWEMFKAIGGTGMYHCVAICVDTDTMGW